MGGRDIALGRRKTLSDQLYGQILEQIVAGALREGDRLPSEHALSASFGVSRPVVREALRRLQDDGLIEARRGVGSFVRRRPPDKLIHVAPADSVASLMRVMEARMTLENATARMAALRADPSDISRIEAALLALDGAMKERRTASDADFAFHLAIAHASHNDVYVAMLLTVRETMRRAIDVAQSITRGGTDGRIDRVLDEHRRIYEAITARDADAAGLTMSYHLLQARHRVTDHARQE